MFAQRVVAGLDGTVRRARGAARETTKSLRLVRESVLPASVLAEDPVASEDAEQTLTAS